MSGDNNTKCVAGNGCIIATRCVLCIDPRKIDIKPVNLREIYEMESLDDPLVSEAIYFCVGLLNVVKQC